MKKLVLLSIMVIIVAGCYKAKAYNDKQIDLVGDYTLSTIEYQGCEYVLLQSYYSRRVTVEHKGNCKHCAERRRQELKELIKELKDK